ncbi:MAG: BlaI/MecI/CopY family transcriptional regulator [Cellulosilyticaceae bacterium]
MKTNLPKISEAELEVMNIVWASQEPLTSQDILERLPENITWKKPTLTTLMSRLVEKGALEYYREGRYFFYTALIDEQLFKEQETKDFLNRFHKSSIKNLVATLYDSKDITKEDLEALRDLIDKEV